MTDGGANGTDLDFNYEELRFIRVADDSKFPKDKWGGYGQDFDAAADVYTHEEVLESTHDRWGVVGLDAPEGAEFHLFVLDLDLYKSDEYGTDDVDVPDGVDVPPIVESQNGGAHLYFAVHDPVSEADITVNFDWVDLRGSAVKSHLVAPADIPGCEDSSYELVNDASIPVFFSVSEVLDRVTVDGEPVAEYDPSNPIDIDFERGEAPDEMPTCYHSALSFRSSEAREQHPNAFKIDTLAGLLGLSSGYSIDEVTEHFSEFAPYGDSTEFDEQLTRNHLQRMARKIDNGSLAPPAISTLRDHGILDADESCTCSIEYHGRTPTSVQRNATGTGSAAGFSSPTKMEFRGDSIGWWDEVEKDDGSVDYQWREIANFRLEVLSYLFEEGERLIELQVIPSSGEESYQVTVPATVFNDVRKFKNNVVTGITTTWTGSSKRNHLDEVRKLVGSQDAPIRQGTTHMGLRTETDEFVTPNGVLTADGWTDDPETVYVERGITPERAWSLGPETHTDYDPQEVLKTIDLATDMRNHDRLLPVLGWLYATAVRPYIQNWEGQFNSLHISGEAGSGKSVTTGQLWSMFGMDAKPMEVDDTKFALTTAMSATNSIPVWYDEYKPGDMADYEVDRFQKLFRGTTVGSTATRGNADKSTDQFELLSPVMVSGEQRIQGSAEERRSIQTRFLKDVQAQGSRTQEAFSKLTGKDYRTADGELQYPEGYDLSQHALAYYRFVLGLEEDMLRSLWREAREHVGEILEDEAMDSLDNLPQQGLQTIYFGVELARWFADSLCEEIDDDIGCDPVPGEDTVTEAVLYAATEMGADSGGRTSHLDEFLELLSRASQAGYLERGTHYATVNEGAADEQLAFHIASAHDAVSKYSRDHDITDIDLLNSASDYRDHMKEHADKTDSYVITHSQVTPPINRCARIDPSHAAEVLDFNLRAFGLGDSPVVDSQSLKSVATPISQLSTDGNPYVTVTVEVQHWESGSGRGPAATAVLSDETGTVDVVDWMGSGLEQPLEEDECYVLKDVRVGMYNGSIQLEIVEGATEAAEIQRGVGHLDFVDAGTNQTIAVESDGGTTSMVGDGESTVENDR